MISKPLAICTGARWPPARNRRSLDVESEQLLAILQHGLAAGLAQRIGDRARGDIDVQPGLTAQQKAGHEGEQHPDDGKDDQQLQQSKTTLVHGLPAGDVLVLALAALRLVGAERIEIVGAVLARKSIDVHLAPRIDQSIPALDVGAVPALCVRRLLEQRIEPVLLIRVAADIEAVQVENRGDVLDLCLAASDLARPR